MQDFAWLDYILWFNRHYYEIVNGGEAVCIDEKIPFDIPESWEWVRCANLISLTSGQDLTPDKYNDKNDGIPSITWASRHAALFFPAHLHLWHMKVGEVTFFAFVSILTVLFPQTAYTPWYLDTFIYFLLIFQLALTALDILPDCHV